LLIVGGFLFAALAILFLILFTPILFGAPIIGLSFWLGRYIGWIGFAICSASSLMLIWIGFLVLNNIPPPGTPPTPKEQLAEDSAKKYPNIPSQKLDEFVALDQEISQLEKEKKILEEKGDKESKEKLQAIETELEAKQKKQGLLVELNEELGEVPTQNRMEYILLKEEIQTLKHKKEQLMQSDDERSRNTIEKINIRIEENLKKMKGLKQ